ncbi:sigma-54-dependent transcriptional regulator [Balneatrix alpica]|uniref:Sigma-54-dependent transcriptional regulator n=1 Tax=Balneatrix alpica TaxID=75684 RepID=A0ABV5ZAN3_9GAMM|nr:sigma-54 dependent transcriptional regulator [Balneatrix alpica]
MSKGQVLLVDDEAMVRQATEQWLRLAGFSVQPCADAASALSQLQQGYEGVLLTDVRMPEMDGLQLLAHCQQHWPQLPVILLTGHGDVDMATQAMRDGAYDFLEKPFVPERLVETLSRACEKQRLTLENLRLQQCLEDQSGLDAKLIGISPAIQKLKRDLLKAARLDTNVIIYGETGTGKELVAQCLHEFSLRHKRPFVPINCGAIPENLIESELFGHEAGAFTGAHKRRIGKFEYADGGTLFLDEIESMPAHLQIRLLRALQEGVIERLGANQPISVNLRVVAAAKVDLLEEEGFRNDLFYRLNVAQLHIPPLRERSEDIPLLFSHYVHKAAAHHEQPPRRLSEQDQRLLQAYPWPGNVRELKNISVRFALDPDLSLNELLFPHAAFTELPSPQPGVPLSVQVAAFEAEVIKAALARHQGNIKAVLDELDLPRRTLNQKMQKYGLARHDFLDDDDSPAA